MQSTWKFNDQKPFHVLKKNHDLVWNADNFNFLGEHFKITKGAFSVPGAMVGNHTSMCLATEYLFKLKHHYFVFISFVKQTSDGNLKHFIRSDNQSILKKNSYLKKFFPRSQWILTLLETKVIHFECLLWMIRQDLYTKGRRDIVNYLFIEFSIESRDRNDALEWRQSPNTLFVSCQPDVICRLKIW